MRVLSAPGRAAHSKLQRVLEFIGLQNATFSVEAQLVASSVVAAVARDSQALDAVFHLVNTPGAPVMASNLHGSAFFSDVVRFAYEQLPFGS